MPLVTIQHHKIRSVPALIAEVREAGAAALGGGVDNVWVTVETTAQASDHPPVVLIRANAGRTREQKTAFVSGVVSVVARAADVSAERVWAHYQEMDLADVWFASNWSK